MSTKPLEEPGILETDRTLVRLMNEHDLEAIVKIDAAASGRRRPRYFELMLERSVKQAALQVSLAAEVDGRVVGFSSHRFTMASTESVSPPLRWMPLAWIGKPWPARRQSLTAAVAAESIGAPGHDAAHRSIVG